MTEGDAMALDRAAARARCGAATPYWYEDLLLFIGVDEKGHGRGWFTLDSTRADGTDEYTESEVTANISFAANARQDLPAALDDLDAADAEIARLRALLAARGIDPDADPIAASLPVAGAFLSDPDRPTE